jgi:hypothetical protein
MPAPLAAAVVAAIARAAVSNAAKKRLMQAAAKKVTQKEIKELIRTEMKTGAPKLGRASRRPDVANPPKRVVENRGSTGSVRPPKTDPAKELYNLYKKKPDTKTVTKSMQKDRVTPADVIAKRIAQKNERIREGVQPSRVSKPPKRQGMTEELRAKQKALAAKRKTEAAAQARRDAENTENTSSVDKMFIRGKEVLIQNPGARAGRNPQSSIESRTPNLESRSELAAFSKLSKAEQKNYNRIEARINEAIKASKKAEREAAKKKSSSKRTK